MLMAQNKEGNEKTLGPGYSLKAPLLKKYK